MRKLGGNSHIWDEMQLFKGRNAVEDFIFLQTLCVQLTQDNTSRKIET